MLRFAQPSSHVCDILVQKAGELVLSKLASFGIVGHRRLCDSFLNCNFNAQLIGLQSFE